MGASMSKRGRRDSPFSFSIISFARFQEVIRPGISLNEAVDPFTSQTTRHRARRPRRRSKRESLNDRRIEKTLYDRVNKRPSGPEKGRAKREEAEKTDDDRVGSALICKPQDFLAWV